MDEGVNIGQQQMENDVNACDGERMKAVESTDWKNKTVGSRGSDNGG